MKTNRAVGHVEDQAVRDGSCELCEPYRRETPTPTPTPPAANEPRCRCCGKPGDSHVATIFENRERRTYRFCSLTCATHYQMGAEG